MHDELQRVLELQAAWATRKTEAMDERGKLVRNDVAGWLRDHDTDLAGAIGVPVEDFLSEGRDGTGLKTRVPWTRFGSRERSPNATDGFYVVYLWAFDGSAVFLSLMQGTTDFINGEFVRKPRNVIESRVAWARNALGAWVASRQDLSTLVLADVGNQSLGRGYELGDVASVRYSVDQVPDDDKLLDDALSFARALGELYRAHTRAPLPFEVPELVELEDAAEIAAGKKRPARGVGFRQNKEERDLIENHAVDVAAAYYKAAGWKVKKHGAPYDLELTRDTEQCTVEVKGTTSMGEAVPLTLGEVKHHAKEYPNNAFVVVRGIVLDRSTSPPTVSGGVLFERQPWSIRDAALTVISYKYEVPDDLYDSDNGVAAEDLL